MMNPFKADVYRISASRLNTGLQCPFKLYLNLCRVEPSDMDTSYISTGSAVHAYVEDLLTSGDTHPDTYYLDAEYIPLGEEGDDTKRKRNVVPAEMFPRYHTCVAYVRKHFSGAKFECEVKFEKELVTPKGRNVVLNGFIDAMSDDLIIDWKTGDSVDKEDYHRQGHVYDYATDFTREVRFISLLSGNEFKLRRAKQNYVPALCDQYIDRIENHDFDRTANKLCNFCEFRKEWCYPGAESAYHEFKIRDRGY